MYKIKKTVSCIIFCMSVILLCSCGNKNKSDEYAAIYQTTIAGLEDNELFAVIETNASSPILLVSSEVYDDGWGNQAAIWCDVYYPINGEVKNIGGLESFGTAYPISYDNTGIYTASGHNLQRFEIDEKNGTLRLAEGIYAEFDENGDAAYTLEKDGKTEAITEEEYNKAFEKYGDVIVVNFSYGASGA